MGCGNRAVTLQHSLQLGSDVQEIDSWGLDCYSRKNIQDGEPHCLACPESADSLCLLLAGASSTYTAKVLLLMCLANRNIGSH